MLVLVTTPIAGSRFRWMGCYSQQEIADAVGYSEKAVREFLDLLRNGENGTDAENPVLSENHELANDSENRKLRMRSGTHSRLLVSS